LIKYRAVDPHAPHAKNDGAAYKNGEREPEIDLKKKSSEKEISIDESG